MKIEETNIPDLKVIVPEVYKDARGYFFESFRADAFSAHGIPASFVQENQSCSVFGVIRGLHYQRGDAIQGKLVRVVSGRIRDVAVDIRPDSGTYGQTFSIELSEENGVQLWIPGGFAHGFSVLSSSATVQYKCDAYYAPAAEGGILWEDPQLDIDWGIPAGKEILSGKDRQHPLFGKHQPLFP